MLFQPFKRATRPETPDYLNAEIRRAELANRAKQQENALRSQNVSGGLEIYSEATAPESPIADYLSTTQEAAPVTEASLEGLEGIPNAYAPAGTEAGAVGTETGYASSVAPEFASANAAAAETGAVPAAEMAAASEGAVAMGAEAAASAAATEAAAAGATAAEIAAVEAAAIEAAAATASTAGTTAGATAAGTGALAAMGPVGWAALAALALSYA